MDRLKVLYIVGLGRSGSTILGNVLGQIEGFVHVGELCFLWSHGLIFNHQCGCGAPIQECPMWRAVLDQAYGGLDQVNARDITKRYKQLFGTRANPPPLTAASRRRLTSDSADLVAKLQSLYQAIQSVNGARVVVDSSKNHMQALALSMMTDVELYMLHLVRDPRGVIYSWQKTKPSIGTGDREYMVRNSVWKSVLKWNSRNLYPSLLPHPPTAHYHRLRYEDFIANPRSALQQLLEWIGEKSDLSFVHGQNEVELAAHQCTINGNPVRFETGKTVTLRPDNEWKTRLSLRDRLITTSLTLPLLMKYGYSVRG